MHSFDIGFSRTSTKIAAFNKLELSKAVELLKAMDNALKTPDKHGDNYGRKRHRSTHDLFDGLSDDDESEASPSTSNANPSTVDWKIFNDPVHGSIRIHPVLVSIIDTPQFQRLRDVKQLGASYWIFPGACHNRFEHSIGTSHLCGKMLKTLQEQHNDLITQKDILCVEIAGLCHDLGHGPFSHVFDNQYISRIHPGSTWTHEEGSVSMFDHLVDQNQSVQQAFHMFGIGGNEMTLVKDLIMGKNPITDTVEQKCAFNGAEKEKWFLFEIVSNKRNGIDCDKFDYLMRDCHYIGTKNNFDCTRYFQNTRIIQVDGQLQICVRDKEVFNLYELFHIRWSLHHRVYQHKTTKIIEEMLCEALSKVDEKFNISGSIEDPAAYTNMTDSIIYEVLRSQDQSDEVKDAQNILRRIQSRQLYKFCGQVNALLTTRYEGYAPSSQEVLQRGTTGIAMEIANKDEALNIDDVIVTVVSISFGMKEHDPINSVVFYSKDGRPMKLRKEQISELLPNTFREKYIRVYCKDPAKKKILEECFNDWSEENGFIVPSMLDGDKTGYFTDMHKDSTVKKMLSESRLNNLEKNKHVRRSILDN